MCSQYGSSYTVQTLHTFHPYTYPIQPFFSPSLLVPTPPPIQIFQTQEVMILYDQNINVELAIKLITVTA